MNARGRGLFSDLLELRKNHKQPLGIINSVVSYAITETVGSTAANYAVDLTKQNIVLD